MKPRNSLFRILLQPLLFPTLKVGVVTIVFVLFNTQVMLIRDLGIWLLWPLIHVALINWQNRPEQGKRFAFLLTRGFTPDQLWRNILLANLFAALLVWLPIAILIRFNLRALLQEHLLNNPAFPIMASREYPILLLAAINYLVFIALGLFNMTQSRQPHSGRGGGKWLVAGILVTLLTIENLVFGHPWWLNQFAVAAAGLVTLITLAHSRTLFQTMEVA
jgi:hypothetical protein